MKLTKILSVIAVVGLLVVGTAFAATDIGDNFVNRWSRNDFTDKENYGYNKMMDLTGLNEEKIDEYRLENCPAGTSMIDYLEDEGLYEEWKEDMLANLEDKLEYQVENGLITQEEANELLVDYEQRIEEGPPYYFGNMRGRGR
ncbi:MAG: hypothetical protein ACLFPS_01865, partial [Clostridia bacterium]